MTQRAAVIKAIAAGKDSPADGVPYVKDTFDIQLTNQSFSTLKSQIKKAAGETAKKPGRPPAVPNVTAPHKSGGISSGGKVANPADLARAVKLLVTQYGAEAVADMTKVFAD